MKDDTLRELAERRRQIINALCDCSYNEHDALWAELQEVDDLRAQAQQQEYR